MAIVPPFVGLCLLLLIGHVLRTRVRLFQKMYLPSCVIAGLVGLVVIQVLESADWAAMESAIATRAAAWDGPVGFFLDVVLVVFRFLKSYVFEPASGAVGAWTAGWDTLPSFLINIVFACLFLGVALPKFSELWRRAGPQVVYGQIVAWGQYVVGVGLVLFLLGGLFALPPMFGGILPVGFEGGHGTAAGMKQVFEDRGWPEGKDFALASATCGIMSAIIVGMMLVNWAARRGHTVRRLSPADVAEDDTVGIIPVDSRPIAGRLSVKSDAIESFTLHIAVVGFAIFLGYLMKLGLNWLGEVTQPNAKMPLLASFPLFPLCMIGGLIVQLLEDKCDRHKLIDVGLVRRIQNSSLDFLVVAAIATINLKVIQKGWVPLLILVLAGIAWNVFCVLVLARRVLPNAWFERSIAEMGQSMGVTATGLLLLRVVDPDYETPAADAFACKQIIHEPFMGGGLWTSTAIPLLAMWGGWPVFGICTGAVVVWLAVAFVPKLLKKA